MKIILMNIPGHGHVNPTLTVVAGLVARGHTILYYNSEEFRAKISVTGADFRAYPTGPITPTAISHAVSTHLVNMTVLLMEASLTLTAFMLDEITREKPDLLIFDAICLWGNQVARLSGLPAVASIALFVLEGIKLPFSWRDRWHMFGGALPQLPKLLQARNALIQRYGRASLPPQHIFPGTGDLNLVYTIRALQPPSPIIDDTFHFVGPSLPARPTTNTLAWPEGRIIYISLGTIHTNPAFYQACFEAFATAPATFVLVAGDLASSSWPKRRNLNFWRAPSYSSPMRASTACMSHSILGCRWC
jgi:MGT family glycosyltransferase